MEQWYYLASLVVSISGLLLIDWRHKVAFWYDAKRTAITIGIAMAAFLAWDSLGIGLGIFFIGDSQYMLPIELAPEFPLEELFFLFLLSYVTLLIYRGASRWRRIFY